MTMQGFFEASAPGRLDVMGGIADYSGSLVLQMPVRQQTTVRISLRTDFICNINSETSTGEKLSASLDYRTLLKNGKPDEVYARAVLKHAWVAYIVGCAIMLQKSKNINFTGADFDIHSEVPLGKGVSSSASLEVATMKALSKAYQLSFSGTELPVLAQQVENKIVGAPCGLMDQLASSFGEHGKLLPIVCQPDKIAEPITIPSDVSFIGIDSGIRHSVGGASYGDVRCAAFMGYSIILNSFGVTKEDIGHAKQRGDFSALPYRGYLCNISVSEFERKFQSLLPATVKGKDFLELYGVSIDTVTSVNEDTIYPVLQSAAHPVYENERVNTFMQLLMDINISTEKQKQLQTMGELMYQSHESYSRCGLGSERTDEIVAIMKAHESSGIAGAKITGGGSGGTVCALAVGEKGKETVKKIHQMLQAKYKADLVIFE